MVPGRHLHLSLFSLALLLVALLAPRAPKAGNDDAYLLGNEAAISGGAVAAVTRSSGAVWYNPAGLGGSARSKVDVSGSAFVLSLRRMPELLVTDLEAGRLTTGIDDLDIRSVPSGLAYIRRVSERVSLGFGLFVPVNEALSVTSSIGAPTSFSGLPGVTVDYQQRVELSWDRSTYYLGAAVGWQLRPGLRLGAALFLTVGFDEERFLSLGEGHDDSAPEEQRYSLRQEDRDAITVGARATVGLQWRASERISAGLVVRSPQISFYQWGSRSSLTDITAGLIEGAPGGLQFTETSLDGGFFAQVAPWRFNLAMALHFGDSWLAVEFDVQTPLDNEAFNVHRDWSWNVRLGAFVRLSDRFALGGGLFTDLAGERAPTTLGGSRINFYGGTFGLEMRTPIALRRSRGNPADLIFITTVALRYALGAGESLGFYLRPLASGNEGFGERLSEATFHELTAHIGSALHF